MPEEATTHVCITVFSCLVKGCFNMPNLSITTIHDLTPANPNSPAATLREGITPVVRFSLQTMKLKTTLKINPVTIALNVICFCHGGTYSSLNASSVDSPPLSSSPFLTI
ncbi:hypothetical protein H5410_048124 [Solanum commersonii]|uniref:Uncharacterized protein n=1 Tax=Solanum commersonii TaxID=4109 RepID=A0A9J5XJ09_SOLCO|nr:hypothetical protein H5410_048124 [Solanum commersonii]